MSNRVYIAIGSNIEPEVNLQRAVDLLKQEVEIQRVSPVYITPPVGYTDQAEFLNAAILVKTDLSPAELRYNVLDWIEKELKRIRDPNNKAGPRTIDLDIALWNDEQLEYGHKPWHVPHGDVCAFAHTAVPLADIAPDYVHPTNGKPMATLAEQLRSEDIVPHRTFALNAGD